MGYSRFVRPDTAKLPLSRGDWILVKRHLTAGEQRQLFGRLVKTAEVDMDGATDLTATPKVEIQVSQVGLSTVLAYLLDWSFPEMAIRGQSADVVMAALDALDTDSYNEILTAINAHEAAMEKERAAAKALPFGETALSVTS